MTARQPMSSADAAWFRMDRPTNRVIVHGVLTFDEPLDRARVRTLMRDRLVAPFPRFRQLVVGGGALSGPAWEDAPDFDLDLHLHHLALAPPGDQDALQELVADLMSAPLDPARPLWDMYVVDGYGDGCAVVMRMHHCIADGIVLARVLMTLTDAGPAAVLPRPARPAGEAAHGGPLAALTGPLRALTGAARHAAGGLAHESVQTVLHPERLLDAGRELRGDAAALIELLAAPGDRTGVLKGDHGIAERVTWTPPLPLPQIKAIAHATGTTVNDVLLAALGGGLARYLAAHGALVDEIHVMVPFNLRPPDEPLAADLGNRFGLILLGLPVGDAAPTVRLADVHGRMAAIKSSRQPVVSYAVLSVAGRAPAPVERGIIDFMSAKSTSVVTNVPGPREPVSFAGVPVREVLVWAPCAGSVSMSVSIFSYQDTVTVGFMTHARLVPDPGALADGLVAALVELGGAVRSGAAAVQAEP